MLAHWDMWHKLWPDMLVGIEVELLACHLKTPRLMSLKAKVLWLKKKKKGACLKRQRSFPSSQSPTEDTVTFFSTVLKWSVRGNSSISYFNRSVCTIKFAYSTWLATPVQGSHLSFFHAQWRKRLQAKVTSSCNNDPELCHPVGCLEMRTSPF